VTSCWLPLAQVGSLYLPVPVALAAVALLGYLVGRWRRAQHVGPDVEARRELKRAQAVASKLEEIAHNIRKDLALHHSNLARFKARISQLTATNGEAPWRELCQEAETILAPTLSLATQMAHAYDEIRQQSNHLMMFTEVRTDPLTGVCNRRALDDTLASLVALWNRYGVRFSLVILDIDHFKRINDEQGHLVGDQSLKSLARLLDHVARETDIVTRYGGEEFVVLLPQTDVHGASVFAERVRATVAETTSMTVSGGVASVQEGDTVERLLKRADAAMYRAKSNGRNRIYQHRHGRIEPVLEIEPEAEHREVTTTETTEELLARR
jgi:diguanylate cyclase